MALAFPNVSRAFDKRRNSVSFWGYDSTSEISFEVDEDALNAISSDMIHDEASSLRVFDDNRVLIEQAASKAYKRRPGRYHLLCASDF